jgi:transposase
MYEVTTRDAIRDCVLVQGHSQRAAAKRFGVSRDTVARLLREEPSGEERRYRRQVPRRAPLREAALPHIQGWLAEDERLRRVAPKQRWTAHRMWQELQRLGVPIAEPTVRRLVRACRQRVPAVFVPLTFGPGERAEFDFGHALVELAGVERQVPYLAGRLRYSGAIYLECFPTERQECFLLGQRHAFEFWGGVPRQVVYDNLKPAVAEIRAGHTRREQVAFTHFKSAYAFEAVFANPAAGWEKGSVENLVGFARRSFLVAIPQHPDLAALNAALREACLADQGRVMAGREGPIAARLASERAALLPLPAYPVEVGIVRSVLVRRTGHVRFQTNEYSAPVRYAGQLLTLRADPSMVRLFAGAEEVAAHPRCYGRMQVVEDFRHYVPVLLEKPFALPFASAVRNGALPAPWERYRQGLVARSPQGNRDFARVLALCLSYPLERVGAALELAASRGVYSADAVRQLLSWASAPSQPPAPLDLATYPAYQQPVSPPDLAAYNRLLRPRREARA